MAREYGFLGPGELDPQIHHARGFAVATAPPTRAVDLGSGGGLPGLVLAIEWPGSEWVLIEAMQRRCAFLTRAVRALGLSDRVRVRNERSEFAARDSALRGWADVVTARGFGVPPLTAESAAPLLSDHGRLIVSEPPVHDPERWSPGGLETVGLAPLATWRATGHYRVLVKIAATPDLYPRGPKAQQRAPLWGAPGKKTA